MLRGLLVVAVHLLLVPVLALTGIIVHSLAPRLEIIPRFGKLWAGAVMAAGGVRRRVVGREIVERTRPAVVVGNHTSHLDTYLFVHILPPPFRVVAKAPLFRIPFFGQAMRAAGMVPVDRLGRKEDIERVDRLRHALREGALLVFFPEGTRRRDGRLGPFKKGAFVVAIQEQVPIVPMVIEGAHRIHPPGSIRFRPGTVTVRFLEPIPTTGLTFEDRDALIAEVRSRFIAALPPDQRPEEP
ncbi:MAG: 1-acyl-sn-glycerol-3-phosphate acyltransferase [Acidobacteria bacterium]|nr:MAG: 1-acyl-sn-glycerol-3-phosphate acyltransferase [Acidobacteriota bacterium]